MAGLFFDPRVELAGVRAVERSEVDGVAVVKSEITEDSGADEAFGIVVERLIYDVDLLSVFVRGIRAEQSDEGLLRLIVQRGFLGADDDRVELIFLLDELADLDVDHDRFELFAVRDVLHAERDGAGNAYAVLDVREERLDIVKLALVHDDRVT